MAFPFAAVFGLFAGAGTVGTIMVLPDIDHPGETRSFNIATQEYRDYVARVNRMYQEQQVVEKTKKVALGAGALGLILLL